MRLFVVARHAQSTLNLERRVNGDPAVVADGRTGFVVEGTADMVRALERIDEIDPAACRAHVAESFSAKRLLDDYEAVYETVLDETSASIWSAARPSAASSNR